ncbi:AraC family transcriptional regulator [Staphylococcus massiliensis]|uniref:AraC family transcriptional regulator n=1 Tax=Staphylococcus massiliensis TaxID=555791 RepID=UPI0030CD0AC7
MDECGIEIGTPHVDYTYKVKRQAVLHYISKGSGTIHYEDQVYHLKAGDLFLLKKDINVSYYPSPTNPWTYYWVGFSGKQVRSYLSRSTVNEDYVIQDTDTKTLSHIIFNMFDIARSYNPILSDDIRLMRHLYDLLYHLQLQFPKPIEDIKPESYSTLEKALNYIHNHYMDGITIHDITEHVNLSRSYLYKLFKNNLDESPQYYLIHLRMYKASQLLLHTNKPINTIAREIGYHDALMFSKAFKKHFSMSASQYRKSHRD